MHKVFISAHNVNLIVLEHSNTVQAQMRRRSVSKCVISQKIRFPLFVVMKTSNVVKAYMPNISSEQNNNLKNHDLKAMFVSPSCARNRHFPKASLVLRNLKR
jgi:hypothetical protein